MNEINPDDEAEYILEILAEDSGLRLREIHNHLADATHSKFSHSPSHGNGYNLERYIVKGLLEYLSVKEGWITADGGKWSLTEAGHQEIT
jgi:hypothetical protein